MRAGLQTRTSRGSFADAPVLKQLRRFHGSIANRILYAVLALAFVGWGVGTFGNDSVGVVAEVHGTRITERDLDRETALLQRRYEQLLKGVTLPRMPDLRGQALDELIDVALVQHEVQRLGLDVTDDQLVTAITQMPELQENGRFNRELFARILDSQRDRGEFEESLRRDLRARRLQSLVADGVQVTPAEVAERYKLDREQVNLVFVRVNAAELAKTAAVTDADLQAELAAHGDRYRTPETVRARYVAYRRGEFTALATPSDAQVRAFYDLHLEDRFTDVEQVRARHILVAVPPGGDDAAKAQARAEAEDLLRQVRAGGDFEALAKKHSKDPGSAAKGGDLGFFPRGRMVPAFDAAAFALEPGQVSELVETPYGFHIVKVEEKKPGGSRPLEAVRDQIVQELTGERSLELARKQADSDRRTVVRGKSLQEAVGDRKVEETPPFAAGADVPGLGRVKAFTDAAFTLEDGEVSDLIETDDAIYMLVPFDRRPPAVPPLDEIRATVEADARRTAAERLAKVEAEKVLARAREVGLEQAAAEAGRTVEETGPFDRRTAVVPKIGTANELRAEIFALTTEAPLAPRVYEASGDAVVVALKARMPADMKDFETAQAGIRDALLAQRRQAVLTAFMSQLKERAAREGALRVHADAGTRG
jgi:peptidyl-prolyl cis-trans isomerase D